jgi:oligopeptide transport system ATP-binding protein
MSLLEIRNLRTHFKTPHGTVRAVDDVSLDVGSGDVLGIVGESGCGKSVLSLSILHLLPMPPAFFAGGKIIFEGRDLLQATAEEVRKIRGNRISMIFQEPMSALNPVFTIGNQLAEVFRVHWSLGGSEALAKSVEMLEKVGVPAPHRRAREYPYQLSGGMRQRVMIAMALTCNPLLLIADEPTTALDVTIQAQIVELVTELRRTFGMAIIWITHDLGVVAGLADRVIVMYAGYIVEEALVDDLYEHPRHPYTMALLSALPRVDRRQSSRLKSIRGSPPSLLVEPRGCPFAPRCEHSLERCRDENPELRQVATGHRIACWVDIDGGATR